MRNHTLDTLKGLLIILVIFAHITSNGPATQHFGYLVGTFFMQLFFGISGYFITQESIRKPFKYLAEKYWYRLVIPLLFAYFIYCLIKQEWLDLFFPYPWFHLWFIVAFLLMIAFLNIVEKLNINKSVLMILFFLFTFFWIGTYGTNGIIEIYPWMGNKAIYYNFIFFYTGYYLRNYLLLSKEKSRWPFVLFIVSAYYIWILNDTSNTNLIYSFIWIIFNLSFIYVSLKISLRYTAIKLPLITWMGSVSLPIYLLHIISLELLNIFTHDNSISPLSRILIYFIGVMIIMFFIYSTRLTKFGKLFILGEPLAMSGARK